MKELRLQSEQRIANDILLLQEDISDIDRARALSTDIAVTDLGSLRLHAGAMYDHIHEEYDHQMASEYENSFKARFTMGVKCGNNNGRLESPTARKMPESILYIASATIPPKYILRYSIIGVIAIPIIVRTIPRTMVIITVV